MKKTTFLLAILFIAIIMLCGCEAKPEVDTPSNHNCIECGSTASRYMGKRWIDYSTVDLYYCDPCYSKVIKEAEENNRIVDDVWGE